MEGHSGPSAQFLLTTFFFDMRQLSRPVNINARQRVFVPFLFFKPRLTATTCCDRGNAPASLYTIYIYIYTRLSGWHVTQRRVAQTMMCRTVYSIQLYTYNTEREKKSILRHLRFPRSHNLCSATISARAAIYAHSVIPNRDNDDDCISSAAGSICAPS